MEKVLCIKIASRGDLLLAAPAFRVLRITRPQAHITLWVGTSCQDVAKHLPYFDEIQTIDDKALLAGSFLAKTKEAYQLLQKMKGNEYSEALIFHRDWRYYLLAWMGQISIRRGFYNKKGSFFLTHPYRAGLQEHHANQYIGVVGANTPLEKISLTGLWQFTEGERESALAKAKEHGFKPEAQNWIALGFGGGRNIKTHTELKMWPLEYYYQLASRLVEKDFQVVWVGDQEDAKLLNDHKTGIHLAGKLSVVETASVLSACKLVVANDTLNLHLAEALSVPTVGLFGPTNPAHYRPLGDRSAYLWIGEKLACSPCHRDGYFPACIYDHQCMMELSVDMVLEESLKRIKEKT